MAIIAVIYCQDSLYRLNAIISSMFIIMALQQLFMPKLLVKNEPKEVNVIDTDLLDRVRRLRDDMTEIELKGPPPDDKPAGISAEKTDPPSAKPTGEAEQADQVEKDDNSSSSSSE